MSSEESLSRPETGVPHQRREDLFGPLNTILARMALLQRITLATPGLTELERTVLLEGIAATGEAAEQLGKLLEAPVAREAARGTSLELKTAADSGPAAPG